MTEMRMFEWGEPKTPWRVVQQRFFAVHGLDPVPFSKKYGLDENEVRMVLGDVIVTFTPELCAALSEETGMSVEFFHNLNDQYRNKPVHR
ncbi:MAG: hypothetical protein KBD06_01870 [Candidatus Pacebacteria bacterium]|nr:hypothetical protein [Candidatus Paceibacterota bacterium]